MILINIQCIELNQIFDFRADEYAPVSQLLEDMVEVICKYAHLSDSDPASSFLLCDSRRGRILDGASTLAESNISAGDTLMLI
ncbi:MAG: EsaB/YukD family protein [Parasporobacterium sp.]|nr:EsaB/YukD family protein [Parasporobacterium sp.]